MNTWPASNAGSSAPSPNATTPGQRHLLHRYAVWHLLHRLRQRNNNTHATHAQAVTVQRHVRAAIALLDGLAARNHTLADARQGDLDAWLTSDQASHRARATTGRQRSPRPSAVSANR